MKTRLVDYHYDECGLENVVLKDFPVIVDDAGEEVISIPNVNRLHQVLVRAVASKSVGLQPSEIRFLRTEMGMSQAELAKIVGKDTQTIGRWERGETEIDKPAEIVIRLRAFEFIGGADFGIEEIAQRTVNSAVHPPILIDAHDPNDYRPIAA